MIHASSLGRIMACGASHRLQQGYPDDDNDASKEGTLAHEWAKYRLLGGDQKPNDLEMNGHVETYVNLCNSLKMEHCLNGVEEQMDDGHVTGTTDFWSWTPYELIIADLKYGYGWVEPENNWQLIMYAILIWLKYGNKGQVIPPQVRLIIYQPRANHPDGETREWKFNGEHLRGYYNQIQNRIGEIEAGNETAVAGGYCRYCRAITDCTTNWRNVSGLLDIAYAPEKLELSPVQLSAELDNLYQAADLIKHRLTALEASAEKRINAGEIVPGYVVKQSYGKLEWTVPDPVDACKDLDVDITTGVKYMTPTQVIDSGKLSKEMVSMMASRKPGAFSLKKQDVNFIKKLMEKDNV